MSRLSVAVFLGCVSGMLVAAHFSSSARAAAQDEPKERMGATAPTSTTIAALRRGEVVVLSGEVIRVIDRDEFRLSDGTGSVPVRMSWTGPAPVSVGDRVEVEGLVVDEVAFGLQRPEVIARSLRLPSGAAVRFDLPKSSGVAPGGPTPAPGTGPAQVFPIGSLVRGQSATISGRVTAILDMDEFRVEDASGSVRVYVGWQNRVVVQVGDRVTIAGALDDEPWPVPVEFYADALTLPDGRVVDLRGVPSAGRAADAASTTAISESTTTGAAPNVPSRIADIRPYEVVLLHGMVERITDDDEFRLRDDSGSIGIYIGWRNVMPVAAGEQVSVIGIVDAEAPAGLVREVYAHEITTSDGRRVELQPRLKAAQPLAVVASVPASPPEDADATLVSIRDVRRGQPVTLRGEVQRLRDTDEFVLRDETGTITIYIGWRNRMPVSVGQRVTVVGVADDDVLPGFRPEIYASHIVLPDGRTVELIRGGRDE